jgi:hypothetical protein
MCVTSGEGAATVGARTKSSPVRRKKNPPILSPLSPAGADQCPDGKVSPCPSPDVLAWHCAYETFLG